MQFRPYGRTNLSQNTVSPAPVYSGWPAAILRLRSILANPHVSSTAIRHCQREWQRANSRAMETIGNPEEFLMLVSEALLRLGVLEEAFWGIVKLFVHREWASIVRR